MPWELCKCEAVEVHLSGWSNGNSLLHLFSASVFDPVLPDFYSDGSFDSALSALLWDAAKIWEYLCLISTCIMGQVNLCTHWFEKQSG